MYTFYEQLIEPPILVLDEERTPYQHVTERHLQAMWLEGKYFKNLQTADGETIEVICPGIWNAEAGPDFVKAHIKINGMEYRGDIEIDFNDYQWQQHKHNINPLYNNVVLHVSLWKPKQSSILSNEAKLKVPQTYLEPALTISTSRILQLIDLDLYPYSKFVGSGKCAQGLFRYLPEEKIVEFFQSAAIYRLSQKQEFLQYRFEDPARQMIAGVALGLGYKQNAEAFLEIFKALEKFYERGAEALLVQALGMCGFFEKEKWEDSSYFQQLKQKGVSIEKVVNLKLHQVRPLNHPVRRLVVLTRLLADPAHKSLYDRLMTHWTIGWQLIKNKKTSRRFFKQFIEILPSYKDEYWNYHYNFESEQRESFLSLLGKDVKVEILINTFLPLLYKEVSDRNNIKEMAAFMMFFQNIPASLTGKARYLAHRFFGNTSKAIILFDALAEQGAYQLHRDFCIHYEASCEGCNFMEQYRKAVVY